LYALDEFLEKLLVAMKCNTVELYFFFLYTSIYIHVRRTLSGLFEYYTFLHKEAAYKYLKN